MGPEQYFDESEFALRTSIEHAHYWHVHRRQVVLRELQRFRSPAACGRLVELGCGIGTVATHLNEHGYTVDYSDVFDAALTMAASRSRARLGPHDRQFLRMDITRPIPRHDYAGMMLLDVIEHLPDDELVLHNVRDALRLRDAFTVITVPAFQMLWSPWDDMERHKRRYDERALRALLRRCGFSVVRMTYFFGPLFFAALAVKGLRKLRDAAVGRAHATQITDLTEGKNIAPLNLAMRALLLPEQAWLGLGSLPLGTSILAIAKTR